MFCSNCGKEISVGNICSKCGMKSESLRAFKKLDLPVGNSQQGYQQDMQMQREKIIYKRDPRQRKIIGILSVFVIIFMMLSIASLIYLYKINEKQEQVQISENIYSISGSIERGEDNYAFVNLTDTLSVDINNEQYEVNKVYLSPDIYIDDIDVEMEGKIFKLRDDVFMIIQN